MEANRGTAPILVTGATGTVGRVVARILREHGMPVRLAQRSVHAADAATVPFDFTDRSTCSSAFHDVDAMSLVRPLAIGHVRRDLLPAVAAARAAGVRHVVFLSLQGAEKNPIVPHTAVERWLRRSGMDWTFVRASFFNQNLSTTHATDIRDYDSIVVPAGAGATAFVDAEDVGAVAAAALIDRATHVGQAWTVTGPRALTYDQVALILSSELSRPIRYTRPGLVHYARHARRALRMPWGMVLVTCAIYTTARPGLASSLTDEVRRVLAREPIDFVEFAHRGALGLDPGGSRDGGSTVRVASGRWLPCACDVARRVARAADSACPRGRIGSWLDASRG